MTRLLKALAVLAVALPLWFLAWRGYEEWRVRAAYKNYLAYFYHNQKAYSTAANDEERAKLVRERNDSWEAIADECRALGLRHPSEWR